MKKTFTVNISGIIFNIDEDAFAKLDFYLKSLKEYFLDNESSDEIISDIELRIAELFGNNISNSKQVITIDVVDNVIEQLGTPFEINDENNENSNFEKNSTKTQKRLYRNSDEKIIGGVCSGIASYFNIDVVFIRIIFILFFIFGGSGLLIYLILWLVVPEAKTISEKLQMKGENINVENIEKKIKNEFDGLKKRFGVYKKDISDAYDNAKKKVKTNNFEQVISLILTILSIFGKIFIITIGILFVSIGLFLLIGLLYSALVTKSLITITSVGMTSLSINQLLNIILTNSYDKTLAIVSILIIIGIPLLMIIYNGIKLIFRLKYQIRYFSLSVFLVWLSGVMLLTFVSIKTSQKFSKRNFVKEEKNILQPKNNILYIKTSLNSYYNNQTEYLGKWNIIFDNNDMHYFEKPTIHIIRNSDKYLKIELFKISNGFDIQDASDNANSIHYNFIQKDDTLLLNSYFHLTENEVWRNQKLKIFLYIPENINYIYSNDIDNDLIIDNKKIII